MSRLRWPDGFVNAPPADTIAGIVCWRAKEHTYQCYQVQEARHRSTAGTIFHATKLPI